jgi:hypothetical protein
MSTCPITRGRSTRSAIPEVPLEGRVTIADIVWSPRRVLTREELRGDPRIGNARYSFMTRGGSATRRLRLTGVVAAVRG